MNATSSFFPSFIGPMVFGTTLLLLGSSLQADDAATLRADVRATARIATGVELRGSADGSSVTPWDTTALADGWTTLTDGNVSTVVLVLNGPAVEGGRLESDATWNSNRVHVVRDDVVVPFGKTLFIAAGTVVKFTEGAKIVVEDGGSLVADGALFADFADDSVGGDTNMDGDSTTPATSWGDWTSGLPPGHLIRVSLLDGATPLFPVRVYSAGRPLGALPVPSREGELFLGWRTAEDGGGEDIASNTPASAATASLYASWEPLSPPPVDETGTTWHVSAATGSDANDGLTAATAFKTIQKAIDSAGWGDKVLVDDGVYAAITSTNLLLAIESVNGAASTVIDGGGDGCAADLDSVGDSGMAPTNTLLRGFTIQNGHAQVGGGLYGGTAERCVIVGNIADYYGGGAIQTMCFDCIITGNYADYYGGGTAYGGNRRCVITNNTAFCGGATWQSATYDSLIAFNTVDGGGGGSYQNSLYHCTVYGNSADQGGGIFNGRVVNCVFAGNSATQGADTYGATMTYSCAFDNADLKGDGEGNITGDPCFVDISSGDFHLLDVSPCIDSGSLEDFGEPDAMDLDGRVRILGGRTDMGAYEFIPPPDEDEAFAEIWGEWSSREPAPLAMPPSATSWDDLAHALWAVRDSFVRSGTVTEVPPSTNAIILSVGAVSVPDSMFDINGIAWPTAMENGVAVVRAHLRESAGTGELALVLPAGETAVSQLPSYMAADWVKAVYGAAPPWLSAAEREEWAASRARSRIEWMATLVPESAWQQYVEAREVGIAGAEAETGESDIFRFVDLSAVDADGMHSVSVQSSSGGIVRLLGKESLSTPLWDYKGLSIQDRGASAAGAVSEAKSQFFMATRQTAPNQQGASPAQISHDGDSDGDGIPDDIERLVLGTNPHRADTSGDGLSDWVKSYRYDLNPTVRDTAGDGVSDAEKIASGNDPRVALSPAEKAAASRSIRYTYDDDDRLTGTWFGLGGASTTTALSPVGNPDDIRDRDAAR